MVLLLITQLTAMKENILPLITVEDRGWMKLSVEFSVLKERSGLNASLQNVVLLARCPASWVPAQNS
jgi:type III secretory pathway component EscR